VLRSGTVVLLLLTGLVPFLAGAAGPASRAELRRRYELATAAHRAGDDQAFLVESQAIALLAPRSLRARYNLACAHALLGQEAESLAILDRLARMGVAYDLAADGDFARIKGSAGFRAVVERMAALQTPVGSSRVAFTVADKELLPEGVTHDPKTGAFFVSSVHERKILRVGPDGAVGDFVPEARDGLLSTLALAVDAGSRSLWVSTDGVPQTKGVVKEDTGRSAVIEYDLDTGRKRRAVGPPASFPGARFADLTVGPGGDLWVADPYSGCLYVLRKEEASFRVFLEPGTIESPQGMAFSPTGRWLFVADYTQGIARVDPANGTVVLLDAPVDAATTGVDGLVWGGGGLVGIQNGVRPHRVVRLRLDPGLERITEVSILERGNPRFDEPTLGVMVGDELYYVANSQYEAFGENGRPDPARLKDPVILRLRVTP